MGARHAVITGATLLCLLSDEASGAQQIAGVTNFQIVSRLTGPGAINNTGAAGIGGTDLGHTVNHNGKTYFLFGDTFLNDTPAQGGYWRHNAMAWTSDTTPANGIVFDDWLRGTDGYAREVLRSNIGTPITEIPTGAISVNGQIYTWYMAVDQWGPPGQWTNERAGLARWQEGDSAFVDVPNFSFAGNSNFGMVAASQRSPLEGATGDDHVYIWGTPAGRFGGVKLGRVAPAQIENRAAYEFFDGLLVGAPTWTSDEFAADLVVPAATGEMSVMYNPAVGAWTLLYFDELNAAFRIRQASVPWGPWSNPVTVATTFQAPGGLYAPYMNPLWIADGGRTIYFTMSIWAPYDVYLARATLVLVPEPICAAVAFVTSVMSASRFRNRRAR